MATTEDFEDGGEGLKRICQACGVKYYDLNRDPISCPSCGADFDPEAVLSSRRNRVVEEPVVKPAKEEEEEAEEEVELGIDQAAAEIEEGALPLPDEDDDDEEDDAFKDTGSDDTLLVEEDDSDDALNDLVVKDENEEI